MATTTLQDPLNPPVEDPNNPTQVAQGNGMMFSANAAASPNPTAKPSNVNFSTDTVEGRVGNLLKTDERGGYTNPVVRQATERQQQAFNARGLLNSSMAMQAGQEAAISKASDIAAVDAATYANTAEAQRDRDYRETARVDEQTFSLRKDYQTAVQEVSNNFQKMVDTINQSGMTPEDKSVAIAQAQSVRDGELTYQNNLYSNMPRWQNEWLALAVPTSGIDVNTINNVDTLSNIVNDPAQSQATRDAAKARLATGGGTSFDGAAYLRANPDIAADPYFAQNPQEHWERYGQAEGRQGGTVSIPLNGSGGGMIGGMIGGSMGFPGSIDGMPINWDSRAGNGFGKFGATTLREGYRRYTSTGGKLSPEAWYRATMLNNSGTNEGGGGRDPEGEAAGSGGSSDSGGMSA